jgi:hypothetical protein
MALPGREGAGISHTPRAHDDAYLKATGRSRIGGRTKIGLLYPRLALGDWRRGGFGASRTAFPPSCDWGTPES